MLIETSTSSNYISLNLEETSKTLKRFVRLCRNDREVAKLKIFSTDPHFLQGSYYFKRGVVNDLPSLTAIFLKPEALTPEKLSELKNYIEENYFSIIALEQVTWNRLMCFELWRYQSNAATNTRQFLMAWYLNGLPGVYIVLKHSKTNTANACDLLNLQKGKSQLHRRSKHDLRSFLGGPSSILNGLHVPDHPLDVIRELSVLGEDLPNRVCNELNNGALPYESLLNIAATTLSFPNSYETAWHILQKDRVLESRLSYLANTRKKITFEELISITELVSDSLRGAFVAFIGNHMNYIKRLTSNFL